jgi:hypothetical protein
LGEENKSERFFNRWSHYYPSILLPFPKERINREDLCCIPSILWERGKILTSAERLGLHIVNKTKGKKTKSPFPPFPKFGANVKI